MTIPSTKLVLVMKFSRNTWHGIVMKLSRNLLHGIVREQMSAVCIWWTWIPSMFLYNSMFPILLSKSELGIVVKHTRNGIIKYMCGACLECLLKKWKNLELLCKLLLNQYCLSCNLNELRRLGHMELLWTFLILYFFLERVLFIVTYDWPTVTCSLLLLSLFLLLLIKFKSRNQCILLVMLISKPSSFLIDLEPIHFHFPTLYIFPQISPSLRHTKNALFLVYRFKIIIDLFIWVDISFTVKAYLYSVHRSSIRSHRFFITFIAK